MHTPWALPSNEGQHNIAGDAICMSVPHQLLSSTKLSRKSHDDTTQDQNFTIVSFRHNVEEAVYLVGSVGQEDDVNAAQILHTSHCTFLKKMYVRLDNGFLLRR